MEFNFSFFDFIEYWDTLKQYINPFPVIMWSIILGVIGFFVALIVEIVLRKKILVRRRHWSLKILSYLYMILFPLFIGFCVSHWSVYHQTEKQLVQNLSTYLDDADNLYNEYIKESVEAAIHERYLKSTGNELIDEGYTYLIDKVHGVIDSEDAVEEKELSFTEKAKAKIVLYLVDIYLKDKLDELVDKAADYTDEKVMLKEGITKDILNTRIEKILDIGVMNTVIEAHIHNIFGGLKMKAILILLAGLAVPLIEIFIAHYLERKRLKKLAS